MVTANGVIARIVFSILAFFLTGIGNTAINATSTIASGRIAGLQFQNSDAAYVASQVGLSFFKGGDSALDIVLVILLGLIWLSYIRLAFVKKAAVALMVGAFLMTSPAFAYYDKTDYTEMAMILPNESAYFIPDAGANKDSQTKFDSESYRDENKIAQKIFQIPHKTLSGSGIFSNFVVPAGRLIIVDRTPYMREWTAKGRGTNGTSDESFHCQSSEGLDTTVEISISTSVIEADSTKYLYNFGVSAPQGDRTDPKVIFTSVYYARSLHEVMDTVGRGKVGTLVCREFTSRTLRDGAAQATQIMDNITKSTNDYLKSVGITLNYVGYAGTFTYSDTVQKSLDDRFAAEEIAPVLGTLQSKAVVDAVSQKWNGAIPQINLPSFLFLPTNVTEWFTSWFKGASDTTVAKK